MTEDDKIMQDTPASDDSSENLIEGKTASCQNKKSNNSNADNTTESNVKNIRKIVRDCQNSIDNFYGLYHTRYISKNVLTLIRVLAICAVVGVCCFLIPLGIKNNDVSLLVIGFLLIWSLFILSAVFFALKNRPMHMIYYKQNDKSIFIYWDNKYYIINCGHGKKFEYNVKHDFWQKYSENDIAPSSLFFDHIQHDLKLTQIDDRQKIDCYTLDGKRRRRRASLVTKNGKPIFLECFVIRMMPMKRDGLQTVPRRIKRRIDFVELNTDKYFEVPKSLIDFCKKNNINPPEESKFLHYSK